MTNADKNRDGSGNFAEDRERASEMGRKGGQQQGGQAGAHNAQQGQSGTDNRQQGGNFGQNPQRASEAGREGGRSSPDDKRSLSQDRDLASEAGRKGGQR